MMKNLYLSCLAVAGMLALSNCESVDDHDENDDDGDHRHHHGGVSSTTVTTEETTLTRPVVGGTVQTQQTVRTY